MDVLEKNISNLIERQFPAFYREEGPVFVEFVKQYYKWLETNQPILDKKILNSTVNINYGNNIVTGINSFFEENFVAGDKIAIYDDKNTDYIIYDIESVSNNTVIVLKDSPKYSFINVVYGTVKEQFNPLYHARHILEYKDVDETTEEFLVYFKEKYLKNIRFETQTNTRDLIKHALDIYRSKGTERSIDLLFRLVFGRGAEVYLPGQDIFKLSAGNWRVPKYIEVSLNDKNRLFAGKQIVGAKTGAKAYVESVIRRNVKGKLIDVLFISAINGNFETGEVIAVPGNDILIKERIKIIGSLTSVDINTGGTGTGYSLGQIINIDSPKGEKGAVRVTGISDVSGIVNFTLDSGGYGYTANAEVIISTKVLNISNLHINTISNDGQGYFKIFEELRQPKAFINFNNATASFTTGDNVYTYWPNNVVKGYGIVLSVGLDDDSLSNGTLLVAVREGDLDEEYIYVSNGSTNTVTAHLNAINGYFDYTSTANIMGISANVTINLDNTLGVFNRNDEVYQTTIINNQTIETANAKVLTFTKGVGSKSTIKVGNTRGVFSNNLILRNRTNISSVANIVSQDIQIGVYDIPIGFVSTPGNYVYASQTQTNGVITLIGSGSMANVSVSNDVIYEETMVFNSDFLADFANVSLNAFDYNFKSQQSNLSSVIGSAATPGALNYTEYTFGKLNFLVGINRGQNYDLPPFVTVYERITRSQQKRDSIIILDGLFNFAPGELITQESTGARGIVKSTSNNSTLFIERMRILDANNFTVTTGPSSQIFGINSGVVANVASVIDDDNSKLLGFNAVINTETTGGNGAITSVEVVDSGFGYENGEEIVFENEQGTGVGTVRLGRIGKGAGYYVEKGGFLSDQKKLFDGNYYQEFSYDILSSVTLNKYEDMLKKILHVAGTKYFSSFVYSSAVDVTTSVIKDGAYITLETPAIITTEEKYVTFNAQNAVMSSDNFIQLTPQPFINGQKVQYVLYVGNTEIVGLSDNTYYYVIESNTSGIKLSANDTSNVAIDITAGLNEDGHAFKYSTDLLLTEKSQIISREI